MDVLARVRRFIRQHDLIGSRTRVVCALSGGSDSVALAHILADLHAAGELQFVGIAHLNHQLRPSADRDEQFCRDLAGRLGRPLRVEREDVGRRRPRERCSAEVAAHRARYALFARARVEFRADVVALGHTRDDQAETFLLRLVRGAGPRGLAGMYPRHGDVVRPLLACARAELREFLRRHHRDFVEDETNSDPTIPRNRVRSELLPYLATHFNPKIADVIAREADLERDIWMWLESELERFLPGEGDHDALEIDRLRAAPRALQRLAMWRMLMTRAGRRPVTTAHVDAAL